MTAWRTEANNTRAVPMQYPTKIVTRRYSRQSSSVVNASLLGTPHLQLGAAAASVFTRRCQNDGVT